MSQVVLINGAPGSGKSTLARMLVDERPLALLLDIDSLRGQLGQWAADPATAGLAARALALAMIRTHVQAGHDVFVPQFLYRSHFVIELERVAQETGSRFVEIVLVSSREEVAARFAARSTSAEPNHRDAARLQQAPGALPIEALYDAMLAMVGERPGTVFIESVPGDIADTFARLKRAIGDPEAPDGETHFQVTRTS
jgi:predicted kinase